MRHQPTPRRDLRTRPIPANRYRHLIQSFLIAALFWIWFTILIVVGTPIAISAIFAGPPGWIVTSIWFEWTTGMMDNWREWGLVRDHSISNWAQWTMDRNPAPGLPYHDQIARGAPDLYPPVSVPRYGAYTVQDDLTMTTRVLHRGHEPQKRGCPSCGAKYPTNSVPRRCRYCGEDL